MSTVNPEAPRRPLRTADLAAAASQSAAQEQQELEERQLAEANESRPAVADGRAIDGRATGGREQLDPLFSAELAEDFRSRWTAVQGNFVDDPKDAVRQGDELVAQVMKSLAESFAAERDSLESQVSDGGEASTETLRVALRRYRSFFERLLSL
jgi:hypothetical protein